MTKPTIKVKNPARKSHFAVTITLGLFLFACKAPPPELVTEHKSKVNSNLETQGLVGLGGDCSGGASQCSSNVCLHIRPEIDQGYICSVGCKNDGDCPPAWGCKELYPSPDGLFCIPDSI